MSIQVRAPGGAIPAVYSADFDERRSRLTTFFRMVTVIPHLVVGCLIGLAACFTVAGGWIAVLLTGRYPAGLSAFNAGVLRFFTRVTSYVLLATDRFPPFGLGEDPDYPVRVAIAPPQATYSRPKALLRLVLVIPFYVVWYVLGIVAQMCAFAAWFVIVLTGRQAPLLQDGINLGIGPYVKVMAFAMNLRDEWPLPIVDHAPEPEVLTA